MDDQKLDQLLDDARLTWRAPEPSTEAIWQAVEAEAFTAPRRKGLAWHWAGAAAAASLVLGVAAGRWSASPTSSPASAVAATTAPVAPAFQSATEEVLGRAAVLLAALRTSDVRGIEANQITMQASRLLGTTRLLIDSPAATDPRMRSLLLDLELTLAQVARLQPARGDAELTLINDAVAERDMVPRIRSAVVDLSAGAY